MNIVYELQKNAYFSSHISETHQSLTENKSHSEPHMFQTEIDTCHGLRTPNEGINQRYLKNWTDVADKICFGRT